MTQLGKGAFGTVFRAINDKKKMVAIKVQSHKTSEEKLINFREVSFLKNSDHSNILGYNIKNITDPYYG